MDFLELFNEVAKAVRPAYQEYEPITDLDMPITETGLDSMDSLMIGIFFCDIYGIPEEIGKTMKPITPRDFQKFLEANKTKDLQGTIEEIIQGVGW